MQENLRAALSRQKSYSGKWRKPLKFNVGDHVYLLVSPTKGVQRFGIKGKLSPRYIGRYEITEECGPMAYRLQLPSQLAAVHNVFQQRSLNNRKSLWNQTFRILNILSFGHQRTRYSLKGGQNV